MCVVLPAEVHCQEGTSNIIPVFELENRLQRSHPSL